MSADHSSAANAALGRSKRLSAGFARVRDAVDGPDLRALNKRIRSALLWLCLFSLCMGIISSVMSGTVWPLFLSAVATSSIIFMLKVEPDLLLMFVVLSPSLNYVITSQIFAALAGNLSFSGFFDLSVSGLIVVIYQAAAIAAYLMYALFLRRGTLVDHTDSYLSFRNAMIVALTSVAGLLLIRLAAFGQSLLPLLIPVAWWAVASVASRTQRTASLVAIFLATSFLLLIVSFLVNQRTYVATAAVAGVLVACAKLNKIVSVRNVLILAFGTIIANVVSISLLAARPDDPATATVGSTTDLALEAVLSPTTWVQALPFLGSAQGEKYRAERTSKYYSNFLAGGEGKIIDLSDSLWARLAQLGHLDIVVGQKSIVTEVDLESLKDEIEFIMPGREADDNIARLYSDVVVWDMGLRRNQLVGRPLVTVAGEMYLLTGIYVYPFFAFVVFFIILVELRILRRCAKYSVAYIVLGVVAVYNITFSGTVLNAFDLIWRVMPLLMIMAIVVRRFVILVGPDVADQALLIALRDDEKIERDWR